MNIKIIKQSGIYTLVSEQIINAPIEEVWDFFTLPKNLDRITPEEMQFNITNKPAEKTYAGQIITYKIGILPFIKSNWITEITHFYENRLFVDEQRFGPYAMWHHEHHFREMSDRSVKMTDIINYKLPFGILGNLIAGRLITHKLVRIFTFRYKEITKLFG